MSVRPEILSMASELAAYRRTLHAHPELAFQETFTSDFVAKKLSEWDIPYERGMAGTGIVAWVDGISNTKDRSIALRGDMDALPITEETQREWTSQKTGCMHACGHDGHTIMVLGTAKYLNENNKFSGRVYFIFQPAEESGGGAQRMINDGLFERYKIDEVYAVHNAPYAPVGMFGSREGPIMAATDDVHITLKGRGGHAALPHLANDPLIAACKLVSSLQTIISRNVNPTENAVISITNIHAGGNGFEATNVIPDSASLSGTVRTFLPAIRNMIEERITKMANGIAEAFDMTADVTYTRHYESTINHPEMTEIAMDIARGIVGEDAVITAPLVMNAEDFGAMLAHKPGNYMFVGQADGSDPESPHSQGLHHPRYDFNDRIIPLVMEYYVRLVEHRLGPSS
jgi:amidohydrolase